MNAILNPEDEVVCFLNPSSAKEIKSFHEFHEPEGMEEEIIGLYVEYCMLSTLILNDTWKRTIIFHTYTKCGSKSCKIVINNGSCMNVIFIQAYP